MVKQTSSDTKEDMTEATLATWFFSLRFESHNDETADYYVIAHVRFTEILTLLFYDFEQANQLNKTWRIRIYQYQDICIKISCHIFSCNIIKMSVHNACNAFPRMLQIQMPKSYHIDRLR